MVADADMDGLAELAEQAQERPEWLWFARFCDLRGRGLRTDALESLHKFLEQAKSWPSGDQLQFTRWLLDRWRWSLNLPQPLQEQLVVPTVRAWAENEPLQSSAHLWLGLLGCDNPTLHVERALDLDPHLDLARKKLVDWALADIDYNQHHMPSFYIHDPRKDLKRLERVERLIGDVDTQPWSAGARQEIPVLRRQAEEWLASHPHDGDYASR